MVAASCESHSELPADTRTVIFVDSRIPRITFWKSVRARALMLRSDFGACCGSLGGNFITIEAGSSALLGGWPRSPKR